MTLCGKAADQENGRRMSQLSYRDLYCQVIFFFNGRESEVRNKVKRQNREGEAGQK